MELLQLRRETQVHYSFDHLHVMRDTNDDPKLKEMIDELKEYMKQSATETEKQAALQAIEQEKKSLVDRNTELDQQQAVLS